jgi:hypothetical protein
VVGGLWPGTVGIPVVLIMARLRLHTGRQFRMGKFEKPTGPSLLHGYHALIAHVYNVHAESHIRLGNLP